MRVYAGELRRAILDHPNLAPLIATRPVFSPATLTLLEESLGELTDLDLAPQQAIQVLDIVVGFMMGHALSELCAFGAGLDPEQLAKARALLPGEQFPRVRETLGKPIDRDAEFDLGMDLLVSGIAGLIGSSALAVELRKRREGDSNPRDLRRPAGFQDQCIRPLCHPSEREASAVRISFATAACTMFAQSGEMAESG